MVNRELQCDWLKVAYSLYKFHWDEAGDFVMCNKHILGDLVERIIHAACMIYVYELRQGIVHILRIYLSHILVFHLLGCVISCTMFSICKARWARQNEK